MGVNRPSAWLTFVTKSEHVPFASVLAKSVRKSMTTKRISVIVGTAISNHEKHCIRKVFDDVFFLDGDFTLANSYTDNSRKIGVLIKLHAWSLEMFEKCIFLQPNSVMLQNADCFFESDSLFIPFTNGQRFNVTCDSFLFRPSAAFSEYLRQQISGDNELSRKQILYHLENFIADFNENRFPVRLKINDKDFLHDKTGVLQFSVEQGTILQSDQLASPTIIQFVNGPVGVEAFADALKSLNKRHSVGITEKTVIDAWIGIIDAKFKACFHRELYAPNEPIAIIGMGCRLPGANNLLEFWNLLYSEKEGGKKLPSSRWKKGQCVLPVGENERQTYAGFLGTSVEDFDAKFFGISPKEAIFMDPQTRILHEVMWECLENAAVDPTTLYGSRTGIFTGSWLNDYKDMIQFSNNREFFRTYMGNSIGAGAARLSHFLGATGPCIATESGCSSAIVAVDMAIKSLRCKETNLAMAGGVNLLIHPFTSNTMEYVIAPDGRCKTFDAKADGFGRAEGCCFLALKRISDAIRDNDNVWAMIRGSAVTQEGVSRSLGTPTVHCEALAMTLALENADVRPEQVSFVEAHGTGTPVGDPMEMAAISKAYQTPSRKSPLVIGCVKTNVGHTESCSGITGIIKTVLALHHELIPKHLNLDTLNPDIDLDAIPAIIPPEPMPWPKIPGTPRIAGVSSFGITGTDAHVILQEARGLCYPKFTSGMERPLHILKISAKTNEALQELLGKYNNMFTDEGDTSHGRFSDVAFTANTGRASFNYRAFILASNIKDAATEIQQKKLTTTDVGDPDPICFLFTGQGSQYPGMARLLYETSPVFRMHFDHCERTLQEDYGISIGQVIWESNPESKELSRTIYSQTSIFCVEYCLLKLWKSWGVQPNYVLGHSLGEFTAGIAAGILTFEDALKLVTSRSRLIDKLPRGSMLVLRACQENVEEMMKTINIDLEIAASNSHEQTVVAGDSNKIHELNTYCQANGVKCIILEASHAFHSKHMDPMLAEYRRIAQSINCKNHGNSGVQYISGMKGKVMEELDADYWVQHTRKPVRFMEACQTMKTLNCQNFLEIGPHSVLSTFIMQNIESGKIVCHSSLRRNANDWETILTSLGKLFLAGFKIDWFGFDKPYNRKKISVLPLYPFQRKSYWVDCHDSAVVIHPLLGSQISNASNVSIFQNNLDVNTVPYLKHHCIGTKLIFPGAAFTEMMMAAGYCVSNFLNENLEKLSRPVAIENVTIHAPLELKDDKRTQFQVIVDLPDKKVNDTGSSTASNDRQAFRCKIYSRNNNYNSEYSSYSRKWNNHASGNFHPVIGNMAEILRNWSGDRIREITASKEPVPMHTFYKRLDGVGLKFGEAFQSIKQQWTFHSETGKEVISEVIISPNFQKYVLHPIVIDAMFQAHFLVTFFESKPTVLQMPVHLGRLIVFTNLDFQESKSSLLYIHAKWTENEKCSIFLCTQEMQPIALIEDLEFVGTNIKTLQSTLEQQNSPLPDCWEETWKLIPGPEDNRLNLTFNFKSLMEVLQEKIQDGDETSSDDEIIAKQVETLVCLYTLRALYQLGWEPSLDDEFSVQQFCIKYKILAKYNQLVHFYFSMLQDIFGIMKPASKSDNNDRRWKVNCVLYQSEYELSNQINIIYSDLIMNDTISASVKIYNNVGNSLTKILTGEESPLAIMFPVDPETQEISAERYYYNHPGKKGIMSKSATTLHSLLQAIYDFNVKQGSKRVMRVLEIGAGTGSASVVTLQNLKNIFGTRFEYYYTDISASFFSKAEMKFEEYKGNLKFATFNIEENLLDQGIPISYFDFVVGFDVLHATKNLRECLRNIRMTLRPHGVLTFADTLTADKGITFLFGLMEGYWRFQDFEVRANHPCINSETWQNLLLESGFCAVYSCSAYFGSLGLISAQANEYAAFETPAVPLNSTKYNKRWIIFSTKEKGNLMTKVEKLLQMGGNKVDMVFPSEEIELSDYDESADIYSILRGTASICNGDGQLQGIIFGWGMTNSGMDAQRKFSLPFLHIAKYMLKELKPPRLYILTSDVCYVMTEDVKNPSAATLFGMAKSLKNENPELFVRCVDLEGESDPETQVSQILFEVAMHKDIHDRDRIQVSYRQGSRFEPRLIRSVKQQSQSDLQLPPSTTRYQLVLPKTRIINDLKFGMMDEEFVGDNMVEVKTKAFALNFRDIFAIHKPTAEFENINGVGIDFAGVITKLGIGVSTERFKVGDRVFGLNLKDGQLPSHLVVDADYVWKIPQNMTMSEAATLPTVFATSIHCLLNVAKLEKGERVLIHTGSGGAGLSAIQIAKNLGAEIITTAGSPRKRAYLRSLGIKHVFHSRNTSYKDDILKATNGRGVDVVLNSLTGAGFKEATLDVCSQKARFVEMSKLSVWTQEEVRALRPDVQYSIVDITKLAKQIWNDLQAKMMENLENGAFRPIPFINFDALRIRHALQFFQKAKHIGKIVLSMPDVKVEDGRWLVEVPLFNGDSTYLITGGMGGIGFEVCKWMLNKGASDIVLIGRHEPRPDISIDIEKLNNRRSTNITTKLCDVGNYDQISKLIAELRGNDDIKPIRGVHHCAGVLRDGLYENQSWESFTATFGSKVDGSWNLHRIFKNSQLEHFVLYSSFTALGGSPGQSNHSAANCFEDALAHYRYSRGLPATSINWGQWAQVGCAKEASVSGILPVSTTRMLNGLEEVFRDHRLQVAFAEFENLGALTTFFHTTKCYFDEKLLRGLKDAEGDKHFAIQLQSSKFWNEFNEVQLPQEKIDLVSEYIKAILCTSLRMDPGEKIKDDDSIQDLGVDSLMMIELRNSIQNLLGSRISIGISAIKDCHTIRQLASVIVDRIQRNQSDDMQSVPVMSPEELVELLNMDSLLDESIQLERSYETTPMKRVLITGVTGQLGPYVLSWLSQMTTVENITCLIRTHKHICPHKKLVQVLERMDLEKNVDMKRVTCLTGDITLSQFGLEQETYDRLCQSIDGIIHLGVRSKFVESYYKNASGNDVRGVNVCGTLNVLKFAAKKKTKQVFYSSTIMTGYVVSDDKTLSDRWPEMAAIKPLVDMEMPGYVLSKYVGEMLVKQANERGIPCKIFRFPWIMGNSVTGQVNYENNLCVLKFLAYLKLKAMPMSSLPATVLPADICAKWSLNLFWNEDAPYEVYNIVHPSPDLEMEFMNLAKLEFNTDIEVVEWTNAEFVEKLYATDIPLDILKELYQDLEKTTSVLSSKSFQYIQGYINFPDTFFSNKKLNMSLPNYSHDLPSTMDIIKSNLDYVKKTEFFGKFRFKKIIENNTEIDSHSFY